MISEEQKKKYEQAADKYVEQFLPHVDTTGHWLGFQAGAEHVYDSVYDSAWNAAIEAVTSMIKAGPEQVYIHSGKIYDELQKLRK